MGLTVKHYALPQKGAKGTNHFVLCALCAFLWLLKDRGLCAQCELVPALKGIDRLARHDADERGFEVE